MGLARHLQTLSAAADPAALVEAIRAVAEVGPAARDPASAPLLRLLSGSRDAAVRAAAVDALQRLVVDDADAVARLGRAFGDLAREVRLRAGLALRALAPARAAAALPALVRLVGDRRDDVLEEVAAALVHVGRGDPAAIQAALAPTRRGRRATALAARALAALGAVADVDAGAAAAWLADGDPWVRACGAAVLAALDLPAAARVDLVVAALGRARGEAAALAGEARVALPLDPAALRARVAGGPPRARALALLLLEGPGARAPRGPVDGLRRRLVRGRTSAEAAVALVDLARAGACTRGEAAAVVVDGLWARDPAARAAAERALDALLAPP